MKDEKMPWFKFYGGDWRKNPELRSCSYAARGLWVDLLTLMHESPRRGYLLIGGNPPSCRDLAAVLGGSWRTLEALLKELRERQVISVEVNGDDARSHVYYSGRMAKDVEIQRKQAEYGRRGGSPSLKATLNPTLKAPLKDTLKPRVRGQSQRSESDIIEEPIGSSSPERPQPAPVNEPPIVMSFPCKGLGEKTWRLTQAKLEEYKEAFPGVDVNGELLKARLWLNNHPKKLKTPGGMGQYLANWFTNCQNAGRASGVAGTITPEPYDLQKTLEQAYVNRDKLLGVR